MNKNESAFPQENAVGNVYKIEGGLTKREYLAMKLYARIFSELDTENTVKYRASQAVEAADILLEELSKETNNGFN